MKKRWGSSRHHPTQEPEAATAGGKKQPAALTTGPRTGGIIIQHKTPHRPQYYISRMPIFPYMSPTQDITKNQQPATDGAVCRTESENQAAHDRACDLIPIDPDAILHHNERGRKPEHEDEEGMIPHN